ncbi:MAG: aspartate-semialdehyde dehydrogenase [Myxococcales bacterium FL481]|nr:MAG: aspartate-semialdehyde dehydrogenase [Myxococcales bacterium FL481]
MTRVGFIGWRGMVGSVLLERMQAERDFEYIEPHFFSTSQVGQPGPALGDGPAPLKDANDPAALGEMDVVITAQGSDHTLAVHPRLREAGWSGYWIDAASALRMRDESVIVLDPVNRARIDAALAGGTKDFIGGNCTVSLMLMAMGGLIASGWCEWISSMTYQAASGSGARHMRELVAQMAAIGDAARDDLTDPHRAILQLDRTVSAASQSPTFPTAAFSVPLAGSLIPWIDKAMGNGQAREEWKAQAEGNKILGLEPALPIDGTCVRIGAMRSHSQALTIKLCRDVPIDEVERRIVGAHRWVDIVPNEPEASRHRLTPAAVTGTLRVPVGRIRKMTLGPEYVSAFTVGDQLLWGAAEPLRRTLRIVLEQTAGAPALDG